MAQPFDYSKWDDIDTDSEPEASPPSIPAPASAPAPAPRAPTSTTTPPASSSAPPPPPTAAAAPTTSDQPGAATGSIKAVIVRCLMELARAPIWSATTVEADHGMFSRPVAPVPELLGIPLVCYDVGTQSAYQPDLDNQIITYLNIDPQTGFAPIQWRSHIGTVVVARRDRKDLLPHHLEAIWMYCDHILDLFGENEGVPPAHLYNQRAFEEWWEDYCMQQRHSREGTGGEKDLNDWRAVRSPYEM